MQRSRKRTGYTLIELILSMSFLTVIVTVSIVSFIGVFGIYSKAQSLTRTQEEARKAMDSLTRDLRQTLSITPITGPVGATIANGVCLNKGVRQVGYAQRLVPELGYYVLARSEDCATFATPKYVMSTDVWSDRGPSLWAGAQSSFAVEQVNASATGPVIWQVRVGAFRGSSAPSKPGFAGETDIYSAGTMLQSIVVTRQD